MSFQYTDEMKNLFLLILSLKKKIFSLFILLLFGSAISYPFVGFVVKDIINRDLPYCDNFEKADFVEGNFIFFIKNIKFQIVSNQLDIKFKKIIQYTSINFLKYSSFSIINSNIKDISTNSLYLLYNQYKKNLNKYLFSQYDKTNNIENKKNSMDIYIYTSHENKQTVYNDYKDQCKNPSNIILVVYSKILSFPYNKNSQIMSSASIVYTKPLEVTILNLKLSLIFGLLFSVPYLLYLSIKGIEDIFKLSIFGKFSYFIFIAFLLTFVLGFFVGYFFIAPFFMNFLYINSLYSGAIATYSISSFISFISLICVIFGILFEFPVFLFILVKTMIIKLETLKYFRRHVYVLFFIVAALITPPDVFTQLIVAIPMIIFYELSIIVISIYNTINRQKYKYT